MTTTLDQSKYLSKYLDIDTADCVYIWDYVVEKYLLLTGKYEEYEAIKDDVTPAWSLNALLQLLPFDKEKWWKIEPNVLDGGYWCVIETNSGHIVKEFCGNEIIDAVYDMICWLMEND